MADAALSLYELLSNYAAIGALIDEGESEGPRLECKTVETPQLGRDLKFQLGRAVSGFANSGGGVILWGVSTDRSPPSGLDILTQISPIGNCRRFQRRIEASIPSLVTPVVMGTQSKILKARASDTKGVVVTYVPSSTGDPVRHNADEKFYFRNGDAFISMPYEMLQRMFQGTRSPDLQPYVPVDLATCADDGTFTIPFALENRSSAVAEHTLVSILIENPDSCDAIIGDSTFKDVSDLNPDTRTFHAEIDGVIHRGINQLVGRLNVRMKGKRIVLRLSVACFADRMRARRFTAELRLKRSGCEAKFVDTVYLY